MYEQVEKPKETKSRSVANSVAQKKNNVKQGLGFVDNRSKVALQRNQREVVDANSIVQCMTDENGKDTIKSLSDLVSALANGISIAGFDEEISRLLKLGNLHSAGDLDIVKQRIDELISAPNKSIYDYKDAQSAVEILRLLGFFEDNIVIKLPRKGTTKGQSSGDASFSPSAAMNAEREQENRNELAAKAAKKAEGVKEKARTDNSDLTKALADKIRGKQITVTDDAIKHIPEGTADKKKELVKTGLFRLLDGEAITQNEGSETFRVGPRGGFSIVFKINEDGSVEIFHCGNSS